MKECSHDRLIKSERTQVECILRILEIAVKGKDADAMYTLGRTFEQGYLVKPDSYVSCKWYKMGAGEGHAQCQTALATMYYYGKGGLKSNMKKSLDLFRLSASQGEREAIYRLGIMLRYGFGTDRDDAKAYYFLEKSANEHDNLNAHFEIGLLSYEGHYLPKCLKTAAFTFMYCALLGHCGGQIMISECYLRGVGLKQNESKACFWGSKAYLHTEEEVEGIHEWVLEWLDFQDE
jgi:TPR repeat protein